MRIEVTGFLIKETRHVDERCSCCKQTIKASSGRAVLGGTSGDSIVVQMKTVEEVDAMTKAMRAARNVRVFVEVDE